MAVDPSGLTGGSLASRRLTPREILKHLSFPAGDPRQSLVGQLHDETNALLVQPSGGKRLLMDGPIAIPPLQIDAPVAAFLVTAVGHDSAAGDDRAMCT